MDGDAFPSTSTEKRAVRKVKRSMPKTPSKRAKIVETLTKSPSTKALLERKGATSSEKSRTLDMGGALLDAMSRSFQSLKVKWGTLMRNEYAAYSGLHSVIHDVKNKIRQETYRLSS